MSQAYHHEVHGLHQFFEDWFCGRVEDSDQAFQRCVAALDPGFVLINPDGDCTSRDDLLDRLRAAHGQYRDTYFRIRIDQLAARNVADDVCLVTYQEWQETDGFWTARWSTALLREEPSAPNGLAWMHVHETWMPDQA